MRAGLLDLLPRRIVILQQRFAALRFQSREFRSCRARGDVGDIARARGMTEIAKAAGITREALYKALRPDSAPRFDTITRVCAALGVRLVAQPLSTRKAAA